MLQRAFAERRNVLFNLNFYSFGLLELF